jgi:hypothetical protein
VSNHAGGNIELWWFLGFLSVDDVVSGAGGKIFLEACLQFVADVVFDACG